MNNIIKRIWNQNKLVQIEDLSGMTFQAESGGHTFQICGINDAGETVSFSGTPSGVFLRPDNTDVTLSCSVSNGVVSATLPAECYSLPGRGGITVFITENGQKTALYAAVVTVSRTSSGNVAPPATQTVVDLVNAISAAVATIPASYSALMADIAPTYSDSALYSVGQYAWYDGDLKRCISPITTAESFTPAHWTSAVLGSDVSDLKSAIDDVSKGNYDLGSWIPDTYIQTNGNTNAYTGWKATNFIQVPSSDNLYIVSTASSQGSYNCFYNANKQKTGDAFSFSSGENSITIPSGAEYFRLSMPNSVNVQVQTVMGNKVEKNTADIIKLTEDADKLITVVQTNATVGKYVYYDGNVYNDNSFMISDPVYIRAGSKIHLYARGYSQNICMIAQTHVDNKWHFPVVNSDGSTAKWYTYDVVRNGYYSFSGNKDTSFKLLITPSERYPDNKISLSMLQKFGVIGDSYASGVIYIKYGVSVQKYECSWGQIMARKFGTQCTNYSSGGLSTRTWLTSSAGLTKLLNHEPEDIYYCALGINDYGQLGEDYLGSLEDITSHQSMAEYADSFYGNYGRIIENIKAHAPHALIVMFTCANTSAEIARRYSSAIIELADYYQIPYIVQAEDPFFATPIYTEMFGGHPTSIGYAGMANAFERLLQDCVFINRDYFKGAYKYND